MKGLSRARWGALSAAVGVLLIGVAITGPAATAAPTSLSGWTQQGATGAGTWTVAGDGNSVTQTLNGAPTFFVSPFLKEAVTFDLDITPATSVENDWVGVVLGYTGPVGDATCSSQDCANSFILLDWKQESEASGQAGFSLIRVNGTFNIRDANETLPCFGTHTDTSACDLLGVNYGTNLAWTEGQVNTLRITYGPGQVKVERVGTLANTTVFDVTGVFPTGRVGLYNYSQPSVTYAVRDLADPAPTTTTSSTTSTPPTTVAAVTSTSGGPTTLAATIVRTGPGDTATIQLGLGAALVVLGAVLTATRGKRPEGAYYQ